MRGRRIGFLPAFFTALAVVFAIAVVWRIRSYDEQPPRRRVPSAAATAQQPPSASADPSPRERWEIVEISRAPNATDAPAVPPAIPLTTGQGASPREGTEPPSLVERIVAPIAEAISRGGRENRTQPAPLAPTSAQASRPSRRGPESPGAAERDKSSDSTPPQLLGVAFQPPVVRDGEETQLIIDATDDLSGVRSVSGTIVAPSGALQGFASHREGESNRYLARVQVPRDAAEGRWRINYLSILDQANNVSTFTAARGGLPESAAFRVESDRPDSEGPVLRAVWIDRPAMRSGEKNTVFVRADDDQSGVNLISGVFQSPSRLARVGFVCRAGQSGAAWECELSAPTCADCGAWQLEQIQMQDKAHNMTSVRAENQLVAAVRVEIASEMCDATPPTLDAVALDQNVVSSSGGGVVTVQARLSDDACGVLSVSGQVNGPAAAGAPIHFALQPSGDAQSWTGRIPIPPLAAKGEWRMTRVQVLDRGHNLRTYNAGDPVLAPVRFQIQ